MIEESQDQRRIQGSQRQRRPGPLRGSLCVPKKEPKRIPVAFHSAIAHLPLSDQALAEEVLQKRSEGRIGGRHQRPPWPTYRSKRRAVTAISSGTAVRYQ